MITLDSPWRRLALSRSRPGETSSGASDRRCCRTRTRAWRPPARMARWRWPRRLSKTSTRRQARSPQAKNPLNLRPGPGRMTPTVTVPGKGEFLVFDAYADCFREWRRRLFDEAETYKAPPGGRGPYALAGEGILDLIADAYCPKGPPGTPEFANDPEAYARSLVTMLDRLNAPLLDQVDDDQDAPAAGIVFGRVPPLQLWTRRLATRFSRMATQMDTTCSGPAKGCSWARAFTACMAISRAHSTISVEWTSER